MIEGEQIVSRLFKGEHLTRLMPLLHEYPLVDLIDCEGNFLFVSPSFCEILGYKEGELLGKNAFDFMHPDDHGYISNFLHVISNAEHLNESKFELRRKDGIYVALRLIGVPLKDENGEIYAYLGLSQQRFADMNQFRMNGRVIQAVI